MTPLRRSSLLLLPVALVATAPSVQARNDEDSTYLGEASERYAMVRALEGDVTIRKGDVEESLSRGTPVAEGDVIESHGRGVLQLGDGTRVAFGGATRVTVSALFTDKDGERQIHLRLDYGRLRLSLPGHHEVRLRVDTPSGTAAILDRGLATVEAERDRTVRLRVFEGRLTFTNSRDEVRLSAGERLTLYSGEDRLDRVRSFNTYDADSFETWADGAVRVRKGESYQRVPREIRYYSDDLDDHGDWVEDGEVGWVWRPRVSVEWRPYWRGRWGAYNGGMTWVSDDPFGYVTFHHGRWGWSSRWGWYWIPGALYAPAWVAWHSTGTYCGWAPLDYWNTPCSWGYGAWGGGGCWNVVNITYVNQVNVYRHITTDVSVVRGWAGNRSLQAPWNRGPVVATHAEFRNPAQFTRALDRTVARERLQDYGRQIQATTGRTVLRREGPPSASGPGPVGRIPFEDRRAADRGREDRVVTPRDRSPENRPAGGGREDRVTSPRERGFESRPATGGREERREDRVTSPRERPMETRPSAGGREDRPREDRPAPRERGFEVRTPDREERRPAERPHEERPREERREERRESHPVTPAPREERRESRPVTPAPREERRESRPAPTPPSTPSKPADRPNRGSLRG